MRKTTTPGYDKDERTGMVVNRNAGYDEILARRRAQRDEAALRELVRSLEERVARLEARLT